MNLISKWESFVVVLFIVCINNTFLTVIFLTGFDSNICCAGCDVCSLLILKLTISGNKVADFEGLHQLC